MNENGGPVPGLWHAILAVQAEAPKLKRDKTATVRTQKGDYSYSYTDLEAINDALGPILQKHKLVWATMPSGTQAVPTLAYVLHHVPSGQQIAGELPLFLAKQDSQSHGSGITYARRYAKVAVLDLVADEDDDGQAASTPAHRESRSDGSPVVDFRDRAKGLTDGAINVARQQIGLPRLPDGQVWRSLVNIPAERADEFKAALDAVKAAS